MIIIEFAKWIRIDGLYMILHMALGTFEAKAKSTLAQRCELETLDGFIEHVTSHSCRLEAGAQGPKLNEHPRKSRENG